MTQIGFIRIPAPRERDSNVTKLQMPLTPASTGERESETFKLALALALVVRCEDLKSISACPSERAKNFHFQDSIQISIKSSKLSLVKLKVLGWTSQNTNMHASNANKSLAQPLEAAENFPLERLKRHKIASSCDGSKEGRKRKNVPDAFIDFPSLLPEFVSSFSFPLLVAFFFL